MKIASIDIGTNTALLLIGELDIQHSTIRAIRNEYRLPRIGMDVGRTLQINESKITLLTGILEEFIGICAAESCEHILLSGTYPFRTAANSFSVIDRLKAQLGIQLRILTTEEESSFSFIGATLGKEISGLTAVIDIGGGSSEVTIGKKTAISFRKSIPFGAVNISERAARHQERSLSGEALAVIQTSFSVTTPPSRTFAVAGTPTALACLKLGLTDFNEEAIDGICLSANEITGFAGLLKDKSPQSIIDKYGKVMEGRADILYTGTLLLAEILNALQVSEVTVSSKGLRHGVVYDYIFRTFGRYFEVL